jgi:hypothetical protein
MATIGNSYLSLIDMYRNGGMGGTAAIANVAEVLTRLSPIVRNAFTVEANSGTLHRHSIRTGLPAVTWGRLYQGIPQSKSTRANVTDTTGFVEGLSTVDTRLLQISPNAAATRDAEAQGFLESLRQEAETQVFYGDVAATPEKIKGLAARYNATGGGGAGNQIVKAGGSGSVNTSVWFVTWSENATHLIHPQGTPAGIERQDKGEQRVYDSNNNPYYVKEELFRWHLGVAVRDWRYNARIANIDTTNLVAGSVDIYAFMRKAFYKLQGVYATNMRNGNGTINGNAAVEGRSVIYMNRTVLEALDAAGTNSGNAALMLKPMELEGRTVNSYRGIPIEVSDAILNTEATIS